MAEWAGHLRLCFRGRAGQYKNHQRGGYAAGGGKLVVARSTISASGQGYDVHAFGPGDHVWLGGVKVAHERGAGRPFRRRRAAATRSPTPCSARSPLATSAAISRPVRSAMARRASSDLFLAAAVEHRAARGGKVAHVDATLICEQPKVGPHRDAIRARIAEIMGIAAGPRGGEGDDIGTSGLYRARRRHRRSGDGHRAAAIKILS